MPITENDKFWITVDFDGVIHSYTTPWQGPDIIPDPPVPGAIQWLWRMVNNFNVGIFSTRNFQDGGIEAMRKWLLKYGAPVDSLFFPTEKVPALLHVDDRVWEFRGVFPTVEYIKNFKPWNKRDG